jgi:CRP/FNR family transcriptional regulator, nitrogen oxide reductase regulator
VHAINPPDSHIPELSELSALRSAPVFSQLPDAALRAALTKCAVKCFGSSSVIFTESEPAGFLFVLLRGKVSVNVCDARGWNWQVHRACSGNLLGLSAVITGGLYGCSAVAESNCVAGVVPRNVFFKLLQRYPKAAFQAAEYLSKDVAAAYSRLATLTESLPLIED